jgi:hypothetical protein
VLGEGFAPGLSVLLSWAGGSATLDGAQIEAVSNMSFRMIVTFATSGQYSIRVTNADGRQSNPYTFTVASSPSPVSLPRIDSVLPGSPVASPHDQTMMVVGERFQAGLTLSVTWTGGGATLSGTQIQNVSSTSFRMIITLGNPGEYTIRVNNPDGRRSNTFSFTAVADDPVINSVAPSAPIAGANDQTMTVHGMRFQPGLTVSVTWNGGGATLSGAQIQNVSSTSFRMIITLANPGEYTIRVNNPDGRRSNAFSFTAVADDPVITSVAPSVPIAGPNDQTMTVHGMRFQSGLTVSVTWNGGGATLSGTQIQNVSSTSFRMIITLANPGEYTIRVNNPNGRQSNSFTFTVHPEPADPKIDSVSPTSPTAGPHDQTMTVLGSGFQSGLTVLVSWAGGGATLSGTQIQNVSSTSFRMIITLANPGEYTIRVNNPDGRRSNTFSFMVIDDYPVISSVSPSAPIAGPNDQTMTVHGMRFQPGLTVSVTWNGGGATLSGTQIQNVSSTSFRMIITLANPGGYTIRVNNPDGRRSNTFSFTAVADDPVITSVAPSVPIAAPNDQTMTVHGMRFQSGLTVSVTWNGGGATLSGTQIQNVSSTSFRMIITLGNPGEYTIRANNPSGQQSNPFSFTAQPPAPRITSVSPNSPIAGPTDQTMTVVGEGFQTGLTVLVTWNGGGATLSGTQIQNVSSTSFRMIITLGSPGQYTIRVNNPNGQQSNSFSFTAQQSVPLQGSVPRLRAGS